MKSDGGYGMRSDLSEAGEDKTRYMVLYFDKEAGEDKTRQDIWCFTLTKRQEVEVWSEQSEAHSFSSFLIFN